MRHNLLYEAWPDRPGVYIDIMCKMQKKKKRVKTEMLKQKQIKCTYVYVA